uniref:Uncharacterized protein n=1 Tax=Chromera velia CCMP2878 TaxID=1169474 RepID=A0A0G4H8P3_9ALVE|mmetsp:Transcript_44712/g.88324  ORF Transcript_44712/g.88324 Transcript_44712/m.88324 type:complete len:483 (-) Transcript_44712:56-1504(-)|eukprot:Cvel_25222.t1-p1 / transcript=Cvel_25222.t1 / gene=Cvel_25222 / organism=Chromera_velia_CCMP2878 / gene_product=hypothetical protein / transcript_product=hypothetical protein / location=Cvel_scaffold2828:2248-3693(+) / protein_length=482 / sequence_SO=supercontig / SO=protein_coding / is_pseudo=false
MAKRFKPVHLCLILPIVIVLFQALTLLHFMGVLGPKSVYFQDTFQELPFEAAKKLLFRNVQYAVRKEGMQMDKEAQAAWKFYQSDLAAAGNPDHATVQRGPLRVLVVLPVSNRESTVDLFERNRQQLLAEGRGEGDSFDFALFHHSGDDSHWLARGWYREQTSEEGQQRRPAPASGESRAKDIVLNSVSPGCKLEFWYQISSSLAQNYHYLWLLDDDLDLSLFHWPLYKRVISKLSPLVSQPAVAPLTEGGWTTFWKHLEVCDGLHEVAVPVRDVPVVAREVRLVELMAAFIDARLWPFLLQRMQRHDRKSDACFDIMWSHLAAAAHQVCGVTGPLVVDASPVVHRDFRGLGPRVEAPTRSPEEIAGKRKAPREDGKCERDWVYPNCTPLSAEERDAAASTVSDALRLGRLDPKEQGGEGAKEGCWRRMSASDFAYTTSPGRELPDVQDASVWTTEDFQNRIKENRNGYRFWVREEFEKGLR